MHKLEILLTETYFISTDFFSLLHFQNKFHEQGKLLTTTSTNINNVLTSLAKMYTLSKLTLKEYSE